MINRPRCRDWSPLATQQLRLRNLIQITGHNIVAEPQTSIYFTLHMTLMSAPFFTSEPLESFRNAIWSEINCQSIHKSTSQFVVVRVWQTSRSRPHHLEISNNNNLNSSGCGSGSNVLSSPSSIDVKQQQRRLSTISDTGQAVSDTNDEQKNDDVNNDAQQSIEMVSDHHQHQRDKTLFIWGVYFSGLVPITKRSEVKLMDNALIFYIHGGFFTSPDYILNESVPIQYKHFYEIPTLSPRYTLSSSSSLLLSSQKALLAKNSSNNLMIASAAANAKGIPIHNVGGVSGKNCDNFNSTRSVQQLQQNDLMDDWKTGAITSSSSSSSPKRSPASMEQHHLSGRLSPSCDVIANLPHKQNANVHSGGGGGGHGDDEENRLCDPHVLKVRFLDKDFFKWEIRRSYNVQKLLLLQEKQRIFRKTTQSANEAMEKICMKSASCLNLQLIANKGMLYRRQPRGNPSLGRTLNRLLATQKEQPKPEDLLKAQELRRKIEMAKFRCRFLTMERDRYKVILRKCNDKCAKLCDENIEKESWLMDDYRELSRSREMAIEQRQLHSSRQKTYEKIKESLEQRQYQLLGQLRDIYVIRERRSETSGFYEINGVCLPNTDSLRAYYSSSHVPGSNNAAHSLSVAMCYVAHVVLLCSSILNIPLRNKIIYFGSQSKIRDDIKMLSEHDREFPLFCRNIPPSDSLLYAAFLLNQNISQIKFMLNVHSQREDIRATLPNLLAILSVGEQTMEKYYGIQESASASFLAIDGAAHDDDVPMSAISETSIDMMVSVPVSVATAKVYSASEENISVPEPSRHNIGTCRNRGSYSDDHLVKCHDSKTIRKANTSSTTGQRKSFSSEPILPTEHIS